MNASIKAKYTDERWNQRYYDFCPRPMNFCGPLPGLTVEFDKVPIMLQLWNLFWPKKILIKICKETNNYAMQKWARQQKIGDETKIVEYTWGVESGRNALHKN